MVCFLKDCFFDEAYRFSSLSMGVGRNSSRGGKTAWADKNDTFSARRAGRKRKYSRNFRCFRLKLRIFVSAGGASEKFRVFCTETAYDVIIFKFEGGGNCPRMPHPPGAHVAELKHGAVSTSG